MRPARTLKGAAVVVIAALAGCGIFDMRVAVFGDNSAKGATVFLDGAPVARLAASITMEGALLRTNQPARGLERCYEPGDTIVADGDHCESAFFTVKPGEHELWVASAGGDTLRTRIDCFDDPRVDVSFKCRVIEQGEW